MTDPTPYTDDDVKVLAQRMAEAAGLAEDRTWHYIEHARLALDAGYRKVTDTPPEPQERWTVIHTHWLHHRKTMRSWAMGDHVTAEYFRDLGNLDAKYEDQGGIGKALEDANETKRRLLHEHAEMLERYTAAQAEVERLTAELITVRAERDYARGEVDAAEHINKVIGAKLLARSADPQDDGPTEPHPRCRAGHGPTEPLFTTRITQTFLSSLGNALVLTGMDCAPAEVLQRVGGSGGATTDLVDIYPHGQRPSDTPTSNDPLASLRELGPNWDGYDGKPISPQALAVAASLSYVPCSDGGIQVEAHVGGTDAEFRILPDGKLEQDDTPTSNQPVTAEMVQDVWVEAHGSRKGRVFELMADALNDQLGRTPASQQAAGEDA